jgi:hypothetical protein
MIVDGGALILRLRYICNVAKPSHRIVIHRHPLNIPSSLYAGAMNRARRYFRSPAYIVNSTNAPITFYWDLVRF